MDNAVRGSDEFAEEVRVRLDLAGIDADPLAPLLVEPRVEASREDIDLVTGVGELTRDVAAEQTGAEHEAARHPRPPSFDEEMGCALTATTANANRSRNSGPVLLGASGCA